MKQSLPGSTATKKLTNMFRPPVWRKQTGSEGRTAVPSGRKGDYQSFLGSGTSFEGKIALSGLVRLEGEFRARSMRTASWSGRAAWWRPGCPCAA